MDRWPLRDALQATGARLERVRDVDVVADFGDPEAEYQAARWGVAVYPAHERTLLEVTGRDRTDWLHNLVTNAVKGLAPHQGCYSFVLDAKGRIQMDCNLLVTEQAIWIDLDRRLVTKALAHLDRYTIAEDVSVADHSGDIDRLALLGADLGRLAEPIGAPHVVQMGTLGFTTIQLAGSDVRVVRHDFAGVPGLELHVPAERCGACWQALLDAGQPLGLRPIGRTTARILQIEAGIPVYGEDMDDTVLPAETNQLERAVSFTKGCYLGQEIVARMRTHGRVARKMVGLRLIGPPNPPGQHKLLTLEGKAAGHLTSTCRSPAVSAVVGLGYLNTHCAAQGQRVLVASDPPVEAEVVTLPFGPSDT